MNPMSRNVVILFIFLFLRQLAIAQEKAHITIADTGNTVISRNIYGQFSEHLGRGIYDGIYQNGQIRMDIVNALKEIKVPNLRWPGGCFADQYHWRDGIGDKSLRPKTVNTTWGMVTEDNSFGTAEFMELCRLVGCAPYIAGNVGTGSPEELKDWVEYLNFNGNSTLSALRAGNGHPEPYRVGLFGIGNESWGCGGMMEPEVYAEKYRTFALFAKSYPGAPLRKIAGGANGDDYHWTEVLMKNIPLWEMWGLSFHYYTRADDDDNGHYSATDFGEDQYFNFVKKALHIEELINKHRAIMDKYDPKHQVAMVIDEWGIWVDSEPGTNPVFAYQQSSMRDALIAASTLNIFNNHADRVKMANLAQTVNVIQSLILTKGDQMLLTPTYFVFDLFKVHQDARLLSLSLQSPDYVFGKDKVPAVNASASVDNDGAVHITLVNLYPKDEIAVQAELPLGIVGKTVTGQVLTSSKFNDVNTFELPDKIRIVDYSGAVLDNKVLKAALPPLSVVMLTIK